MRERQKTHERNLTLRNKLRVARGEVRGGIKKGTFCDEHWDLPTNGKLLITTFETNGLLYAGKMNSNF